MDNFLIPGTMMLNHLEEFRSIPPWLYMFIP